LELDSCNSDAKRSLQSLEDRLRAQHAAEIDELRRQLAAQSSASFDALKLQQDNAIATLQMQLKDSKAEGDELRSQLQAAVSRNSQLHQSMQEEARKFERQTVELQSAFSVKLREAETTWQAELSRKQSAWEEEVAR
jgi:5S rRNA maturation endonuclease (ribonuclease M5)